MVRQNIYRARRKNRLEQELNMGSRIGAGLLVALALLIGTLVATLP